MFVKVPGRETGLFKPLLQDTPTRTAKREIVGDRAMTGCLADDEHTVAGFATDNGVSNGYIAVLLTEPT